jgi:aminopeptidase N
VPGTNLTRDEARSRAALVSVDGYAIDLDLTTGTQTFRSTTVVTFRASTSGSTFIDLIAPTVHEVVLNGRALPVDEVVSTGRIALPELAGQNELRVVAD